MSKQKRTFESNSFSVRSLDFQSIFEVNQDGAAESISPSSKKEIPFTKEMLLRLIEWLEKK